MRVEGDKSFYLHTVNKGHTLYSISKVYDVTVEEIYADNPEARAGLKIGQILKIPSKQKNTEAKVNVPPEKVSEPVVTRNETPEPPVKQTKIEEKPSETTEKKVEPIKKSSEIQKAGDKSYYIHHVDKGHTLYSIAKVYEISIEEICAENPEAKAGLKVGQSLRIPVKQEKTEAKVTKAKEVFFEHVVQKKETLYRISKEYNTTIAELKELNPGLTKSLYVGQKIKIPKPAGQKTYSKRTDQNASPLPDPIIVGTGDLQMQLFNRNKIELTPGVTSNIVVMLINNSDSMGEFGLKVNTPEGWSQLMDYSSVLVEQGSKKLKIFSFFIGEYTQVGDYTIDIDAYDRSTNEKIGTVKIPASVEPRYEISVRLLDAPEYVFSGDTMTVHFMIQNLSNIGITIQATIVNTNTVETKTFPLAPDSSMMTSIFISTEEDIEHYMRKSVTLTAVAREHPETKSSTSYTFNVLPTGKVKFDAFNRIPVRISGLFVTDNQLGAREYGAMFNIEGGGVFSEKKMRKIEFRFRGPNRQGNPLLGQTDEYYIKYSSLHSNAVLGDNSYNLTDLTEGQRDGRGAEYEQKFRKLSVGSFISFPRFYPDIKQVISVYGSYFPNEKYKFNLGYLNKTFATDTSAHLLTVSGAATPFKWGNIELEYAAGLANGKITMAYSTALQIRISRYNLFFNFTSADKNFPGYLSNSRYISTGISATFWRKLNLNASYNFNHVNMALDTMYGNAPFSDNLSFAIGYQFHAKHSSSIGFNMRGREDKSFPKQFYYREYTVQLSHRSKINRFDINVYGAYGIMENFLPLKDGEMTTVFNANLSLQYQIIKSIMVKAFVTYRGGQQYLTNDLTNFYYGCSIDAKWENKILVRFQYQNNYEVEEYYRDRSLLSLVADYTISKNHEIGVGVNYSLKKNYLNKTQLGGSLNYTYTINIPISRRKDIGSLQGKVLNKGVEKIDGIVFTLAGNIAVTDENGEFEFPFVKTGTYFLLMDNSKSQLNIIATTPGPYRIEILPGQKHSFEISLTKSGRITGEIIVVEDENKDKKGYIPVKEELKNLIVEAKNGDEMYRVFSKQDGTFNFEDLRPGRWTVKVYNKGIPPGYILEKDEFYIDLLQEQVENIDVTIKKKSREIKFQQKN